MSDYITFISLWLTRNCLARLSRCTNKVSSTIYMNTYLIAFLFFEIELWIVNRPGDVQYSPRCARRPKGRSTAATGQQGSAQSTYMKRPEQSRERAKSNPKSKKDRVNFIKEPEPLSSDQFSAVIERFDLPNPKTLVRFLSQRVSFNILFTILSGIRILSRFQRMSSFDCLHFHHFDEKQSTSRILDWRSCIQGWYGRNLEDNVESKINGIPLFMKWPTRWNSLHYKRQGTTSDGHQNFRPSNWKLRIFEHCSCLLLLS